ncbi:hypothetical protein SAMN04488093_10868 [Tropicibacter naphthalenivorans]|uniref:Nitronate monooxygenase n=1 Tax=Tropicibacter naphthalenivorans TaxID=441103 RepID=A0A0P1GHJ3_9RHOB|nr:hypothetical protein TRN7648_03364 [Tropicibacter naphthalenivorans]SMC97715.1 hypothetical protein SAMN04488093_10868 [Tropicibacter naphthalenivorans]
MTLPAVFDTMRLPLIGAPMFILSGPELVIAQCKAGIVGTFPALNARERDGDLVQEIREWFDGPPCADVVARPKADFARAKARLDRLTA